MFECVEASCSLNFFGNFILQNRTNERQGTLTYASFMEWLFKFMVPFFYDKPDSGGFLQKLHSNNGI